MNILELKLDTEVLSKKVNLNVVITRFVQPFREMPPVLNAANGSDHRMNAHDLFSHYTAQVIGDDIIYAR